MDSNTNINNQQTPERQQQNPEEEKNFNLEEEQAKLIHKYNINNLSEEQKQSIIERFFPATAKENKDRQEQEEDIQETFQKLRQKMRPSD